MFTKRLIPFRWLAAALIGVSTTVAAQEVVRIQDYPGMGNLMVRVAIANKICEKNNIKCELKVIPNAPLGVQTMLAGDIEVQWGPPEVAIQAYAKGADIRIIGGAWRGSIFFLVAGDHLATPRSGKGYPAVMEDLRGKKIGVTARGTAAEFQLIELLRGAGMGAKDVTLVGVGSPNTALPALINKQVDAVMAFEPMGGFCEILGGCRMLVDPRKGEGPEQLLAVSNAGSVQSMRLETLQKKPKMVAAYIATMKEAEAFIQNPANYAAVLKIANDTFKIDVPRGPDVVASVLKNTIGIYRFAMDAKSVQAAADYLLASKQMANPVDTSKLIHQP